MDADAIEAIRQLRGRGTSERAIARRLGVTRHAVRRALTAAPRPLIAVPADSSLAEEVSRIFDGAGRTFRVDVEAAVEAAVTCLELAERVDAGEGGAHGRGDVERTALALAEGATPETDPLIGILLRRSLRILGVALPAWLEADLEAG